MSEFHAEAPQATASEGIAQGLYVAARAGFSPTTLRMKVDESTNEPPRPAAVHMAIDDTLSPVAWLKWLVVPRLGLTEPCECK